MKKFFKASNIGFVIVIIICITFAINSNGDHTNISNLSGNKKITKNQYDKLNSGMTLDEVIKTINSEGEITEVVFNRSDNIQTIEYTYQGVNGATASFLFSHNILVDKKQNGL